MVVRTSHVVMHERTHARDDGALRAEHALELVEHVVQRIARRVDLERRVHVEEQERVASREEGEGRFELCGARLVFRSGLCLWVMRGRPDSDMRRTSSGPSRHSAILSHALQLYGSMRTD